MTFQQRVAPWMQACFGSDVANNPAERNHRFLEESLELVQSNGMPKEAAQTMLDYVYSRPVGETHQDVGGVMVTLAALCLQAELDMHQAGDQELDDIWKKIDQIRAKHDSKRQAIKG